MRPATSGTPTPSTDSPGTDEGFTPVAAWTRGGVGAWQNEGEPMCPEAKTNKSRALKDEDAPTLDWIETQEFPVQRLYWRADPIHVSSAGEVENMGTASGTYDAGRTLHLAEVRL